MAMKVLTAASAAAVIRWTRAAGSESSARTGMLDTLFADGIRAEDCVAPKGGSEFYTALKDAVVAGFSKDRQALLAADIKSLSDGKKIERRVAQQSIGKYLGHIRDGLDRREKATKAEAAEAAIREMATKAGKDADEAVKAAKDAAKSRWEDRARKVLATLIDQAQAKEAAEINDMAKFIAELKSAQARLK